MELAKRIEMLYDNPFPAQTYHEVAKYSPKGYNSNGVYEKDEWTDMSDIGKEFNGRILLKAEYLKIENSYIQCARQIMSESQCSYLTIGYIEKSNYSKRFSKYKYKTRIYHNDFERLMQYMLRGYIYCHLINIKRGFELYVGYDYYMIIRTPLDDETLNKIIRSHDLYLDPRSDKYDYIRD